MSAPEPTITGASWARALPAARARRRAAPARVFNAVRCPLCGRVGRITFCAGGALCKHAATRTECWIPGHRPEAQEAAA